MNEAFERISRPVLFFFQSFEGIFSTQRASRARGADVIVKKKTCTVGKDHLASKSRNIKPKYWGLRLCGEERRAPRTLDRNEQILYCRMCNDVLNEMQLLKYKKGGKCRLNKKKNVYKAVKRFFFSRINVWSFWQLLLRLCDNELRSNVAFLIKRIFPQKTASLRPTPFQC